MSHIAKFASFTLWLCVTVLASITVIIASAYLYLSPNLPSVELLRDIRLQTPLRIYSHDQQLIGEFGEKRRTPINYENVPPLFVKAILAAEDDRFFRHHGVDLGGLVRAASELLLSGQIQSGGSTITMQVAKNYFLSQERTFSRKFNEILLALQIEKELSKEQILELYLNKIFLGNRAYGVEAASQVYYGKPITELNLAQWAMIAGLPKAPSTFNPLVNPSRAIVRRNWILGRMRDLGYIDETLYQQAVGSPITASYHGSTLVFSAPYVAEMARREAVQRFGESAYTDGYNVFTTIDSSLQMTARKAVIDGLMDYDQRHGYRGPEQQFPATEPDNHEPWLKALQQTPRVGGLIPAIVSDIKEQSFDALLEDGEVVTIEWDQGLKDLRRYVTVNRRTAPPQSITDLVSVGDLIRLKQDKDHHWQLTQLPAAQAAMVSLNADDGAILSLVGGFDYQQSKFNRVTQAARQPGSNFKPFIYSAALENGFTAASIINDAPIVFEDAGLENVWRPTNASGKFFGPTRLRQALFKSRNLVSIRLLRSLGIPTAIEYAARFGFDSSQLPHDLSLALGSHSLTPMQIVSAYAVLANGGFRVEPYLIERIETVEGSELYRAKPLTVCHECEATDSNNLDEEPLEEAQTLEDLLADEASPPEEKLPVAPRVMNEQVAYIINSMLQDVVTKGTAQRAKSMNRSDLAGKTGTTNGPTDAWFSGYGGGVVTTAWLGFDKNELLGTREYGGSAALPIWIDYMTVALRGRPETIRPQPEGIVTVKIDPKNGLLARPGQRDAIFEIFRTGNVPTQQTDSSLENADEQEQLEETAIPEDIF